MVENGDENASGGGCDSSDIVDGAKERLIVAPRNEALLQEQNMALWNEYVTGAWVHPSPPEVGGLLCRLPLPAQLTLKMRDAHAAEATGGSGGGLWGKKLQAKLLSELPKVVGDSDAQERLWNQWSGNTAYCYKMAEGAVEQCMKSVMQKAKNGRVNINEVTDAERELLLMYNDCQQSWQQVSLVLATSSGAEAAVTEAVAINRPLAFSVNQQLARVILFGNSAEPPVGADAALLERFVRAFGAKAAVYIGGPERQDEPATCIHGLELDGSEELAPGVAIFSGGVEAAVDGVLAGRLSPLDFRFFIGRCTKLSEKDRGWCALACARPVALKQCIQLPKPLWHEVLELAGGELAEVSRIEILKRDDLEE